MFLQVILWGGQIIRYNTDLYPEKVVGLVFIDAPHEGWFDYFRDSPRTEVEIINFNKSFNPGQMTYKGTHLEEWENSYHQIIPVTPITSIKYNDWIKERGYRPTGMKIWVEMQASLIDGVNDSKHIITDKSSHWLHMEEPELVVDAVKELIEKYRDSEVY